MSAFEHIARANRLNNAGGCYPYALAHATTMAIMLKKLARVDAKDRPAMTAVALFLWLTQDWGSIDKASDIPNFIKISGATSCREHAFRTYYDGTLSWAEYARPCKYQNGIVYLWQPMPDYFNAFFQHFITAQSYDTPFLNPAAKTRLFKLISSTWKTPRTLARYSRVHKSSFFNYFTFCAKADNTLTAIARVQLIAPQKAHHKSAMYYQQLDSDRIRYKIFSAHNRYLSRLIVAARRADLYPHVELFLKTFSLNLIKESVKQAGYLSNNGKISQFELDTSGKGSLKQRIPAIIVGSRRSLEESDVSHFFAKIYTFALSKKPTQVASKSTWRDYFNAVTYRMTLLFIVLTGARPTHSISILSSYYWGEDLAFIKDKGRLRQLIICDYLQHEMHEYLTLKAAIRTQLGLHTELDELWYLYDEADTPMPMTCRKLRLFMNKHWPSIVPYQLRHFFSHCAHSYTSSKHLFSHDIDRLMGHENLGERLGSDTLFPQTLVAMKTYLNTLPQRLRLEAFSYV